jgi:hypothetical protein
MAAHQVVVRVTLSTRPGRVVYYCRMCGRSADSLADGATHAYLHVFPDGGGLIPLR